MRLFQCNERKEDGDCSRMLHRHLSPSSNVFLRLAADGLELQMAGSCPVRIFPHKMAGPAPACKTPAANTMTSIQSLTQHKTRSEQTGLKTTFHPPPGANADGVDLPPLLKIAGWKRQDSSSDTSNGGGSKRWLLELSLTFPSISSRLFK